MIMELSNGIEKKRRVTGTDRRFVFEEVRLETGHSPWSAARSRATTLWSRGQWHSTLRPASSVRSKSK